MGAVFFQQNNQHLNICLHVEGLLQAGLQFSALCHVPSGARLTRNAFLTNMRGGAKLDRLQSDQYHNSEHSRTTQAVFDLW